MAAKPVIGKPIVDNLELFQEAYSLFGGIRSVYWSQPEHWGKARRLKNIFQIPDSDKIADWRFLVKSLDELMDRSNKAMEIFERGLKEGDKVYLRRIDIGKRYFFTAVIKKICDNFALSITVQDEDYPGRKSIVANPTSIIAESEKE